MVVKGWMSTGAGWVVAVAFLKCLGELSGWVFNLGVG